MNTRIERELWGRNRKWERPWADAVVFVRMEELGLSALGEMVEGRLVGDRVCTACSEDVRVVVQMWVWSLEKGWLGACWGAMLLSRVRFAMVSREGEKKKERSGRVSGSQECF